ncbi:MAG: CHC2 zinc finger domain-containing protein [Paludibacteraceae bacterium]|nr:CHC2 zinc finger domain-containing protein [Paludibacteraceae bacterium]
MIPRDIIERIYATARIEEVVGDYVSLKRRGGNLWGLCPFPGHTEKTPSFSVNPARNIYKCFGCGQGGNAVNFVIAMEQCSYPEALKKIAKKYNIEVPDREMTAEEQQRHDDRESMFVVNDWANEWYQKQLWETEEGRAIGLSYYHQRGLSDQTIRKFKLGYSPAKAYLLPKAAREAGYKEEYLINNQDTGIGTGICGISKEKDAGEQEKATPAKAEHRLYDRYHGRVIFPFFNVSGKTTGFAGRILEKSDKAKYVNSPESIVYSKRRELYGISQAKAAIVKKQRCYLVEGQMDCISMSQAGIENVVCSGGTSLTVEQIRLIHRFTENVTILYDGDAAGVHAALRGIDMFLDEGISVKVMLFPDGDDPDSFARKHTADEFVQYISDHEEDFIRYKTRAMLQDARDDIRLRSEAVHSIAASIAYIPDRITRDMYIRDCAREFKLDEATILHEVMDVRKKHRQEREANRQKAGSNSTNGNNTAHMDETAVQPVSTTPSSSASTTDVAFDAPVKNPPLDPKLQVIDTNYRNLMRVLIRFGEDLLYFQQPDGSLLPTMVGVYIQQYLSSTHIDYTTPLYKLFFDEFNQHCNDPDFDAEAFFALHPNPQISALTADLLSDKYTLSRIYAKTTDAETMTHHQLYSAVLQVLYELHFAYVELQMSQVEAQIQSASIGGDEAQLMLAMSQQTYLIDLRRTIAELLGKY